MKSYLYQYTSLTLFLLSSILVSLVDAADDVLSCNPCIDRSQVKIGVVHHGVPSKDVYWQGMNIAIKQGSTDMSIDLVFDEMANEGLDDDGNDQTAIFVTMATLIQEYCNGGEGGGSRVHGLLVSLPDPSIISALDACKSNDVRIATFNAGPDLAAANGYKFFGQNETLAGYQAGDALAKVESTTQFCCTNHAVGVDVLTERCNGMAVGVVAGGKSIDQVVDVPVDPNNCTAWKDAIIEQCSPSEGEDWSSVGLYLAGQANHICGVEFLREYPMAYATASDVSDSLYQGMYDGLTILFGIDQQSYLQGYLPFSMLTLWVTNDMVLENPIIETGPHLVTEPPSNHYQECATNNFEVCGDEDGDTTVEPTNVSASSSSPVPQPTLETPPPVKDPTDQPSEAPLSRALRQQTTPDLYLSHPVGLVIGGFVMVFGGLILAN